MPTLLSAPTLADIDYRTLPWRALKNAEYQAFAENFGEVMDQWGVERPSEMDASSLPVTAEQERAIISLDKDMVRDLEEMDAAIQSKFGGNVALFVDYDEGTVCLVKPSEVDPTDYLG